MVNCLQKHIELLHVGEGPATVWFSPHVLQNLSRRDQCRSKPSQTRMLWKSNKITYPVWTVSDIDAESILDVLIISKILLSADVVRSVTLNSNQTTPLHSSDKPAQIQLPLFLTAMFFAFAQSLLHTFTVQGSPQTALPLYYYTATPQILSCVSKDFKLCWALTYIKFSYFITEIENIILFLGYDKRKLVTIKWSLLFFELVYVTSPVAVMQ